MFKIKMFSFDLTTDTSFPPKTRNLEFVGLMIRIEKKTWILSDRKPVETALKKNMFEMYLFLAVKQLRGCWGDDGLR